MNSYFLIFFIFSFYTSLFFKTSSFILIIILIEWLQFFNSSYFPEELIKFNNLGYFMNICPTYIIYTYRNILIKLIKNQNKKHLERRSSALQATKLRYRTILYNTERTVTLC